MLLSNASSNFSLASSGIKNQITASAQRAYFYNNVLFGPEYSYQSLYDGEHMNTLTLDLYVYIYFMFVVMTLIKKLISYNI